MNKLDLAKEQLAAIDASAASEEARTLESAIADYVKAHPDAAGASSGSTSSADAH